MMNISFFVIRAGFLRNPSPFDEMSYKQKKSRLRINSCVTCRAGFLRNPSPFDAMSYKQKQKITLKN